jgi:hypothetical protein
MLITDPVNSISRKITRQDQMARVARVTVAEETAPRLGEAFGALSPARLGIVCRSCVCTRTYGIVHERCGDSVTKP